MMDCLTSDASRCPRQENGFFPKAKKVSSGSIISSRQARLTAVTRKILLVVFSVMVRVWL